MAGSWVAAGMDLCYAAFPLTGEISGVHRPCGGRPGRRPAGVPGLLAGADRAPSRGRPGRIPARRVPTSPNDDLARGDTAVRRHSPRRDRARDHRAQPARRAALHRARERRDHPSARRHGRRRKWCANVGTTTVGHGLRSGRLALRCPHQQGHPARRAPTERSATVAECGEGRYPRFTDSLYVAADGADLVHLSVAALRSERRAARRDGVGPDRDGCDGGTRTTGETVHRPRRPAVRQRHHHGPGRGLPPGERVGALPGAAVLGRRDRATGEREPFIDDLPGYPDNIHRDAGGLYWVGLVVRRNPLVDRLHSSPSLMKILPRIPERLQPHAPRFGWLIALDGDGRVRPQPAGLDRRVRSGDRRAPRGRRALRQQQHDAGGRSPAGAGWRAMNLLRPALGSRPRCSLARRLRPAARPASAPAPRPPRPGMVGRVIAIIYYYTPQGTELHGLRYDWFTALELPGSRAAACRSPRAVALGLPVRALAVRPGRRAAALQPGNLPGRIHVAPRPAQRRGDARHHLRRLSHGPAGVRRHVDPHRRRAGAALARRRSSWASSYRRCCCRCRRPPPTRSRSIASRAARSACAIPTTSPCCATG